MEHARITIVSPTSTSTAPAAPGGASDSIDVMFNPTDYSITRNVSYAPVPIPGLPMPLLQFVRGDTQVLQLELFLDASDRVAPIPPSTPTTDGADPRMAPRNRAEEGLAKLRGLVQIDAHTHAPPVVKFTWGGIEFQGVVAQLTEKFTMFDGDGRILRARVSLHLKSYISADTLYRRLDRQSPDRTKTRVLHAGERLDVIAAQEYGDPSLWSTIAKANGIARPRAIPAGTLLVIPPLE